MTALVIVFLAAGIIALMVLATILRGWVLSILWGWFVVPIFGFPPLAISQAIGIAITISLVAHQYVPTDKEQNWQPFVYCFLYPLVALLAGWIVRAWI